MLCIDKNINNYNRLQNFFQIGPKNLFFSPQNLIYFNCLKNLYSYFKNLNIFINLNSNITSCSLCKSLDMWSYFTLLNYCALRENSQHYCYNHIKKQILMFKKRASRSLLILMHVKSFSN